MTGKNKAFAEHQSTEGHVGPVWRLRDFVFDTRTGELTRNGCVVALAPTPARLLTFLVERPGRLISRDEIRAGVWGDRHVEFDPALNFALRQLRKALDDRAAAPRFIRVVPRRGCLLMVTPAAAPEVPVLPEGVVTHRTWTWAAVIVVGLAASLIWSISSSSGRPRAGRHGARRRRSQPPTDLRLREHPC